MELLDSEQGAKDFVLLIGMTRANRLLELVCSRINRRIHVANESCFGQFFDDACIVKASWEVDLIYKLKLGMTLLNTDTPADARARIIARRKSQREAAALRRSQTTSE